MLALRPPLADARMRGCMHARVRTSPARQVHARPAPAPTCDCVATPYLPSSLPPSPSLLHTGAVRPARVPAGGAGRPAPARQPRGSAVALPAALHRRVDAGGHGRVGLPLAGHRGRGGLRGAWAGGRLVHCAPTPPPPQHSHAHVEHVRAQPCAAEASVSFVCACKGRWAGGTLAHASSPPPPPTDPDPHPTPTTVCACVRSRCSSSFRSWACRA